MTWILVADQKKINDMDSVLENYISMFVWVNTKLRVKALDPHPMGIRLSRGFYSVGQSNS